jgi:carboxymethylenebutenolidase
VHRARFLAVLMLICAAPAGAADRGSGSGDGASQDTAAVQIGSTRAFVAWPAGERPAPAVIVAHEWWGLNAQIRRVARQLARQGYVAIVPDLYHGKVADDAEGAHELSRGLEDDSVLADMAAASKWLASQPRTRGSRVGVIGFCMGGRVAEQAALADPSLAAVVMFYGPPVMDPADLAKLKSPLMGHFGAEDRGIPVDRVQQFEKNLKDAGKEAQIFVYPGAGHAFMNDSRDSFHPDASRQAWARTLDFLQKQLKLANR